MGGSSGTPLRAALNHPFSLINTNGTNTNIVSTSNESTGVLPSAKIRGNDV